MTARKNGIFRIGKLLQSSVFIESLGIDGDLRHSVGVSVDIDPLHLGVLVEEVIVSELFQKFV